jgi:choline/glycine/proline betaine transport protein
MFIARISRGRTIREFVVGVLFVPAGFTFLWMTVFGNTAIALDLGAAHGAIAKAVDANLSTALFKFLAYLPGAGFTSALAITLVAVFFITSADSGALVIDTLASGGADETPRWQRVYWCLLLGVTATLLLLAGGLGALQTATLLAALPFCIIMLLLAVGLVRQTSADLEGVAISEDAPAVTERLKRLFVPANRSDITRQIAANGVPALETVRDAMLEEGWAESDVQRRDDGAAVLTIRFGPERVFRYHLTPRSRPLAAYTALEASESRRSHGWIMSGGSEGQQRKRDLTGLSTEQITPDILLHLEGWRPATP